MLSYQQLAQIEIAQLKRRVQALERALGRSSPASLGGGGIDYDLVVVGGIVYVPAARTTKFLQVNADGSTSWAAAMPAAGESMPANAEIFDVTKNHIHLPGEAAG